MVSVENGSPKWKETTLLEESMDSTEPWLWEVPGKKHSPRPKNLHKTNLIHEPEAGMTSNFCHLRDMLRERSPVYPTKQLAVRADKAGLHSLLTRYGSKIIKIKLQKRSLVPDPQNISTKFASNYSALRDMMQEIEPQTSSSKIVRFSLLQNCIAVIGVPVMYGYTASRSPNW